jgi:carbonic anhydrase
MPSSHPLLRLFLAFFFVFSVTSEEWSYEESDHWAYEFPTCGGRRQSPIDIVSSAVVPRVLGDLDIHLNLNLNGLVMNNGHTIQFDPLTVKNGISTPENTGYIR